MQNILVCVFETNFTSQVSKGLRFPSESFTLTLFAALQFQSRVSGRGIGRTRSVVLT